jgi:hypothetical protein
VVKGKYLKLSINAGQNEHQQEQRSDRQKDKPFLTAAKQHFINSKSSTRD